MLIIFWFLNVIIELCLFIFILFNLIFFKNHSWYDISETRTRLPGVCLVCALRWFCQRSISISLNTCRMWTLANTPICIWKSHFRRVTKCKCLSCFDFGKCHVKTLAYAICPEPSTRVISKLVQMISAACELWSHVDLCKCTRSINNAVLSCVNYSIQGYANAHSAEQVRRCYSNTRRDIERSHRRAWPVHCDQHVLCSWL